MSSWTRSVLIAIAAADPSPAAVITCARGLLAFPATQTPETLDLAGGIDSHETVLADLAAERLDQPVSVRRAVTAA